MGSGWKFEVIQKTMDEADNQLSISMLCEIAGVSRSEYYRWVNAKDIREERPTIKNQGGKREKTEWSSEKICTTTRHDQRPCQRI